MAGISKEDQELAAAARKVARPAVVAKVFRVSKQAVNDWGRRRPIPRHARDRLRSFVAMVIQMGVGKLTDPDLIEVQEFSGASPTTRPKRKKAAREITDVEAALWANKVAEAALTEYAADETDYMLRKLNARMAILLKRRRDAEGKVGP